MSENDKTDIISTGNVSDSTSADADSIPTHTVAVADQPTPTVEATTPDATEEEIPGHADGSADHGAARRPRGRRALLVGVAVAAVLALAACSGGYAYAANTGERRAQDAYQAAIAADGRLRDATGQARRTLDGTKPDMVKDTKTLDQLREAIEQADAQAGVTRPDAATGWQVWRASAQTKALRQDADQAEQAADQLGKAVDAVDASRDARTLDTARAALRSMIDQADRLAGDSEGKVQDNATRDALGKAIDQARTTLDGKDTDAKALKDRQEALGKAIDAVNASVAAKSQADQRAAQEAPAADPTTVDAAGSYAGSGGSYGWTGTGAGAGGSYGQQSGGSAPAATAGGNAPTAPAAPTPTAPTPSQPTNGGSDGGRWVITEQQECVQHMHVQEGDPDGCHDACNPPLC